LAGAAVFWYLRQAADVVQPGIFVGENMVEQRNDGSAPLHVQLSDGSAIVLDAQSSIRYPVRFTDDRREVYLSGGGFFEITKDPQRPFLVYANELVTRVLGTSFTIRAYDREPEVVVEVRTGKVSVFTQQEMKAGGREKKNTRLEGVVLTPNQKVVYSREDSKLVKSLVENPSLLPSSGQAETFEFNDTPMREVFAMLEEAYGVEIVFDEEVMANCYLNALLTHESLEEKLALVCKAVNAHYEVMDTHIIIYGQGCGKHH
jgi:transmembrane sensor